MNQTEEEKLLKDLNKKLQKMNLPPAFLPASHEPQTEDNKVNMLKDAKARGLYFS